MTEDFYRSQRDQMGGWAKGDYMCKCLDCEKEYLGDKRSWQCAKCAWQILDDDQCAACERHSDKLYPDESVPPSGWGDCLCHDCASVAIAERIDELESGEIARLREEYFKLTGHRSM